MKAITGTRKQQLIFLVTDAVARKFKAGNLHYDGIWEQMGMVTPDPLVYASTDEAELDTTMPLKDTFAFWVDEKGSHTQEVIKAIQAHEAKKGKKAKNRKPRKQSPANEDRCIRAESSLSHYEDGPDGNVIDLLTDLRHFCDREGLDFAAKVATSLIHFAAETKGDD